MLTFWFVVASEWFNPARLSAAVILVLNWFRWFHFPIKGRWCWSLQESGVRACGYWTGLIVQVKYNSWGQTLKRLLSEIYFKARLVPIKMCMMYLRSSVSCSGLRELCSDRMPDKGRLQRRGAVLRKGKRCQTAVRSTPQCHLRFIFDLIRRMLHQQIGCTGNEMISYE